MFNRKDRDKYHDFSIDLYEHSVIDENTIKDLNNNYKFSKEHNLDKEKDDYERWYHLFLYIFFIIYIPILEKDQHLCYVPLFQKCLIYYQFFL